ncbi:hypothetical protein [Pseudomonas peli]|uniref:hypothetical protein n=1 Tax=Pseudomonas peli TaxID=592361 RepID=UPI0024AC85E7|nr:hypothetical protein [Pseudomonas peli]
MKSDWDDAPDYIRNNKKQSPWRMVVILGVGSAITWGLIALFAKPNVIDVNQLKQAIRVGGQPVLSEEPAQTYSEPLQPIQEASAPFEPAAQVAPPSPSQSAIEWSEQQAAPEIASGQNSFNDDNYTPKQPANIFTPTDYKQVASVSTSNERKSKPVRREQTAKWIKGWNGGTNYLAEWVAVNNYIDSTSVCANHRRGSIDYRECRKAAKQHYHEECRKWRVKYENDRKDHSSRMEQRYCSAASSFSPMG